MAFVAVPMVWKTVTRMDSARDPTRSFDSFRRDLNTFLCLLAYACTHCEYLQYKFTIDIDDVN